MSTSVGVRVSPKFLCLWKKTFDFCPYSKLMISSLWNSYLERPASLWIFSLKKWKPYNTLWIILWSMRFPLYHDWLSWKCIKINNIYDFWRNPLLKTFFFLCWQRQVINNFRIELLNRILVNSASSQEFTLNLSSLFDFYLWQNYSISASGPFPQMFKVTFKSGRKMKASSVSKLQTS